MPISVERSLLIIVVCGLVVFTTRAIPFVLFSGKKEIPEITGKTVSDNKPWKSAAACSCGNACYLLLKGSKCSEVSLWSAGIYCSFRSYRFTCVEKK